MTKKHTVITAALVFIYISIEILDRYVSWEKPSPRITLDMPANLADYKTTYPIGISGMQSGITSPNFHSDPKLRIAVYDFYDKKKRCLGSLTCVIDIKSEFDVTLLVFTSLPVEIETNAIVDYSFKRAAPSSHNWTVLNLSKRPAASK